MSSRARSTSLRAGSAEGPRIFLNASRPTPILDQSRFLTLATAQWRGPPSPRFSLFVLMPFRAPPDNSPSTSRSPERSRRRRISAPSSPLPARERIEEPALSQPKGEGPYPARDSFRARFKILSPHFSPLCHSRAQRRIPDPSSPLPVRERIKEPALSQPKGEGPCAARDSFRARPKILSPRVRPAPHCLELLGHQRQQVVSGYGMKVECKI